MRNLFTALAVSLVFSLGAAWSAQIEKIKVGNWEGGAYTDDNTNSFLSCTVGTSYANGTYFNISVLALGGTGIGVYAPNLELQVGESIPGTIKIDERYFSSFEGRAISETGVSIVFSESDIIFDALRRGRLLTLTSKFGVVFYNLNDTAKALAELKRCADKYRPFARQNTAQNAWVSRSKWFNDPQYSALREAALGISSKLIAEGKDSFSEEFYDELDEQLLTLVSPDRAKNATSTGAMGTGIVVSPSGDVLTNLHVIKNCISPIEIRGAAGVVQSTTVLLTDPYNDLALLQTPYKPVRVPAIRESQLKAGEPVAVIGFPLLTYDLTITEGIISSLSGVINPQTGEGDSTLMTISAPANRGNSGGPVLDSNGLVVGVLTAGRQDAQNTNFAIKSAAVREFLNRRASYNEPRQKTSSSMTFEKLMSYADGFTVRLSCSTGNVPE
jgi:S1-C subfamily serine protease